MLNKTKKTKKNNDNKKTRTDVNVAIFKNERLSDKYEYLYSLIRKGCYK